MAKDCTIWFARISYFAIYIYISPLLYPLCCWRTHTYTSRLTVSVSRLVGYKWQQQQPLLLQPPSDREEFCKNLWVMIINQGRKCLLLKQVLCLCYNMLPTLPPSPPLFLNISKESLGKLKPTTLILRLFLCSSLSFPFSLSLSLSLSVPILGLNLSPRPNLNLNLS